MESTGKKRKARHEAEEEDDDEKIEQFFALIRNIKEARQRLMNDSGAKNATKQEVKGEKGVQVWRPSFVREDFVEEKAPVETVVGSSQVEEESKEDEEKDGLDLKLSL